MIGHRLALIPSYPLKRLILYWENYVFVCCMIYFILFLLYNIVLVLPHINMNPPRVYVCSQSRTPLPPPSVWFLYLSWITCGCLSDLFRKEVCFSFIRISSVSPRMMFQAILFLSACISFYICIPRLRHFQWQLLFTNYPSRDFPGGPVAKTPYSQCRGLVSTPGQGTRPCMLQLKRFHMPQLKIPQAATKTADPVCCNQDLGQPKKYLKRK